eukprot:CAMPEP_0118714024 /NCGR_PEP_ID=MMETSP0800-20121206/25907_1 /TAXON_ID=210618 ORGANISM="Striatella unipunctata, Strain CCMP2910" /NCGR_SAMPLE_ID=MMETSP0800 /ASSEMBLY_ACC=CAM_ASM_000638 /LENGTH=443 /DNA_ID=CAMNT_0006619671 /DNA_START=54 /DNA_END=1386 /DNA_ORIENTATION=-
MSEDDDSTVMEGAIATAIQSHRQSFPDACPFREAKTTQDVKEVESQNFRDAFQEMRRISVQYGDDSLLSPDEEEEPLTDAMDQFSLGAIVAHLAAEMDRQKEETKQEEENKTTTPKEEEPRMVRSDSTSTLGSLGLARALQVGTAVSHEAAENVHFVKNFIRGQIDRDLYGDMVLALYYVYDVLEAELKRHAVQHFPSLHFPTELDRTEALEDDVEFWLGMDFKQKRAPSPATRDYVNRIRDVARKEPLLLLSHAYTRYLGDLSGGRILARVARNALGVKDDGLRFYEFDRIPSPKKFKDAYREALNSLKLTETQIHRLVKEANIAFTLNMRIFEELDVKAGCSDRVRDLKEALDFHDSLWMDTNADDAKCPFLEKKKAAAATITTTTKQQQERCPWPFVFFHDPMTGMKDYQTWVVIALFLAGSGHTLSAADNKQGNNFDHH